MNEPPFRSGDFVWTNFPQSESIAKPGPRHIVYTVMVAGATASVGPPNSVLTAIAAYTTSQPWTEGARPRGVFEFDQAQAERMGQHRPFTVDLRCLAWMPITEEWFPDLHSPGHGIVGRVPEPIRQEFERTITEIVQRQLVERRGPSRPR